MEDIVLITADSVRRDYVDEMEFVSSQNVTTGITASSYTRPSLASIHSSSYRGAIESSVVEPTLAQVLSENGYSCLGLSPNPNTHETFGFGAGFDRYDSFIEPGSRGNRLRQFLAQFDPLLRVYYRFFPPHAKSENRPRDEEVVEKAIEWFRDAEPPRFLWIHFMETHRPYGRGDQTYPDHLDRKAIFSPDDLTDEERSIIEEKYTDALSRVDGYIERLIDEIDSEPSLLFTSDHGEAFGEVGYYFHPPQDRLVDDVLVEVPVAYRGFGDATFGSMSLLDLAPTILGHIGAEIPDTWQGNDPHETVTDHTLTIAPWNRKATVLWQDFETRIESRDGRVSFSSPEGDARLSDDVPEDLEEQLRDLGYMQ